MITTSNTTSCGDVWYTWTTPTGSSATYTVSPAITWHQWTGGITTTCGSATGTAIGAWSQWVTAPSTTVTTASVTLGGITWSTWNDQVEESAEQKEARRAQEAAWAAQARERQEQWAKEEEVRKAAAEKAEKLLKDHLGEEERSRYERAGYFLVKSHKGNLYKVKKGTHGNVIRLDPATKEEIESLCVQPSGVPTADANLAQKLWIEHAEEEFRRIANIRQLPRRAATA